MNDETTFPKLIQSIRVTHGELVAQVEKAVNISLTLRNWLIGHYIAEYGMNGKDRAEYGDQLFSELARALTTASNCNRRQLYRYYQFYTRYPGIVGTLIVLFETDPCKVVSYLSYSHFEQLVAIDDTTKRAFYETECIRGNWSVRELRRQVGRLYYERSGLSLSKKRLSELTQQNAEVQSVSNIRDPYVFELLGLKPAKVMGESHFEQQLIEKLKLFLLELGHGFCFEVRIRDEHFFVDLVFYHRILKYHVLVELKLEQFTHENLSQLNTYVSWYKENMMVHGDNPPVGILLCTGKNQSLVEYALAGMDNHLCVSNYLLELPNKNEMQRFMDEKLREVGE